MHFDGFSRLICAFALINISPLFKHIFLCTFMHFSIINERIRARFGCKITKKTRIKCNQMKKRQEYERKLTQIIPNAISTFQKNHQLFSFLLLQYYLSELQKNYFHFKQTSPTAIIKWHFTIPKSIPVYPIIEKPFLALTICQLSFTPTYSNENFC